MERLRRRVLELESAMGPLSVRGVAPFPQRDTFTGNPGNPPTPNPYAGIPGFDDYEGGPRIQGDALSGWDRHKVIPGQGGFPTRDRVQEISTAAENLGQHQVLQSRGGVGRGESVGGSDFLSEFKRRLRKLYQEAQ
jgi:hypothetical protein